MTIDSIGVDFDNVLSLGEWLECEEVGKVQRYLEEKIMNMLFSHDPESVGFQMMAAQLAWIGSRSEAKPHLEREIIRLNLSQDFSIESCGFWEKVDELRHNIGKATRKVGHFVEDHAVEIAVGAAICATGVGIAVVTGYTLSAAVGGVVVAGAGSIFQADEKPNPYIPPIPLPDPNACSQTELALIQQGLSITLPKIDLPSTTGEILVTANGIWANGQFFSTDAIMKHSMFSSILQENTPARSLGFSMGYRESDWRTFHAYLSGQQESNGNITHQARGECALVLGNYNQAVVDLGKAIEANPTDSLSYLERGAAQFGLGEYDRSLEDYQKFISQTETINPLSISEFCLGFAKGLPKGTYDSGEGMLLFLVDFVNHPIQTSKQALDSITALVDLVRRDEWGTVAEALSPEFYQLVTQWDTLPSDQKGELAGYAVGKHGAEILLPGALAKVASKSMKSAQELVAVCKNLQIAQETLLLETAAGIGNSVKITEVIEAGQKTAFFAEELGFTAREMGQLKQAGKLEGAIANNLERIANNPALRESHELFKNAQKFLKPYTKEFMSEAKCRDLIHESGIPTFPRPENIPENFRIKISDKGAGMLYVHSEHTRTSIRVMPGKPHSPFPHQQKPYIIQTKDGNIIDKLGNIVESSSPEAHISLDNFVYLKD